MQVLQFFLISQNIKLRICFQENKSLRISLLHIGIIQQVFILRNPAHSHQ